MAGQQGVYLEGYPSQEINVAGRAPEYEGSGSPEDVGPTAPATGPLPGGRKKRAYAGQAYEFGAGPNSTLGGQQPAGGAYGGGGGFSQQQHEAGYPQGGYQQVPAAVQQPQNYAHLDGAGVGGYQPPAPIYPNQVPPVTVAGGVAGMTQQFGQMDMSQKPQPQATQRGQPLNQLYPSDLINQPFNVAELDYPPPPAILPLNVSQAHQKVPRPIKADHELD